MELYIIGVLAVTAMAVYGMVSFATWIEKKANENDKFESMKF